MDCAVRDSRFLSFIRPLERQNTKANNGRIPDTLVCDFVSYRKAHRKSKPKGDEMHVAGLRAAPDTPAVRRYLLTQIRAFAPVYVFCRHLRCRQIHTPGAPKRIHPITSLTLAGDMHIARLCLPRGLTSFHPGLYRCTPSTC